MNGRKMKGIRNYPDARRAFKGMGPKGEVVQIKKLSPREQRVVNEKLLRAVNEKDLEGVKKAIAGGAEVDARDERGNTPLLIAAITGNFEMIKFLVEKANADVNVYNKAKCTAIDILPKNEKSLPIVAFLRRFGAKTAFELGVRRIC